MLTYGCLTFYFCAATLTVNHGRIVFFTGREDINEIVGVATLDLGGSRIDQYFDCISTNGVTNLVWERDGGSVRFPTEVRDGALRLNMAPDNADPVDYPDLDIYTCRDTVTGDRNPINVTGGIASYSSIYILMLYVYFSVTPIMSVSLYAMLLILYQLCSLQHRKYSNLSSETYP